MLAKERQAKIKKLDAILSKISGGGGILSHNESGGSQSQELQVIPEDQIKVEVLDSDEENESYVRPIRLIPRTGLEPFPRNPIHQINQQSAVVVLNNGPSYIEEWNQLQMKMDFFDDCAPIQVEPDEIPVDDSTSEEGILLTNSNDFNSVEARRTVLDAYLYQESEHGDSELAFSSYDYGIPQKDTFVVVHPSESVGIICKVCKRAFETKKALKRHSKEAHKMSQSSSIGVKQSKDASLQGGTGQSSVITGKKAANRVKAPEKAMKIVKPNSKDNKAVKAKTGKLGKEKGNARFPALQVGIKEKQKKINDDLGRKVEKKLMMKAQLKPVSKQKIVAGAEIGKVNPKQKKETGKIKAAAGTTGSLNIKKAQNGKGLKTTIEKNVKVKEHKTSSTAASCKRENDEKPGKKNIKKEKQKQESRSGKVEHNINAKKKNSKESNAPTSRKTVVKENKHSLSLSSKSKEMPFICRECGEGFRNATSLEKHAPVHSMVKYHCYRCSDVFMNMRALTKHLLLHENEPPVDDHLHRCRTCSQGFKTSRQLRGHMLEHEKVEKQEQAVSKPNRKSEEGICVSVKSLSDSTREAESHCSKKSESFFPVSVNCDPCNLKFDSYLNFENHVTEKHINLGDTSLQCDKCGKIMSSETGVVLHLIKEHKQTSREARATVRQRETNAMFLGINASIQESPEKGFSSNNDVASDIEESCEGRPTNSAIFSSTELEKDMIKQYDQTYLDFEKDHGAKSPINDKSCVLEEQESRTILQALFIDVSDDWSESYLHDTEKQIPHKAFCGESIEPRNSEVKLQSGRRTHNKEKSSESLITLDDTGNDTIGRQIKNSDAGFSSRNVEVKSNFLQKENQGKETVNILRDESTNKVGLTTDAIIDLSIVGIDEDDDDDDIDWFWKNEENEDVTENRFQNGKTDREYFRVQNVNNEEIVSENDMFSEERDRNLKSDNAVIWDKAGNAELGETQRGCEGGEQIDRFCERNGCEIGVEGFENTIKRKHAILANFRSDILIPSVKRKAYMSCELKSSMGVREGEPGDEWEKLKAPNQPLLVNSDGHCSIERKSLSHKKDASDSMALRDQFLDPFELVEHKRKSKGLEDLSLPNKKGRKRKQQAFFKKKKRQKITTEKVLDGGPNFQVDKRLKDEYPCQEKLQSIEGATVQLGESDTSTENFDEGTILPDELLSNEGKSPPNLVGEFESHVMPPSDITSNKLVIPRNGDNHTEISSTSQQPIDDGLPMVNLSSLQMNIKGDKSKIMLEDNVEKKELEKEACPLASLIYVRRRAAVIGEEKLHAAKRSKAASDVLGDNNAAKKRKSGLSGSAKPFELTGHGCRGKNKALKGEQTATFTNVRYKKQVLKCSNLKINTESGNDLSSKKIAFQGDHALTCSQCKGSFHRKRDECSVDQKCKSCSVLHEKPVAKKNTALLNHRNKKESNKKNVFTSESYGIASSRGEDGTVNSGFRSDSGKKKLSCDACGKAFNTSYFLGLHRKRHESTDSPKHRKAGVFRCNVCYKVAATKQALAQHLKLHKGGMVGKRKLISSNNANRAKKTVARRRQKGKEQKMKGVKDRRK